VAILRNLEDNNNVESRISQYEALTNVREWKLLNTLFYQRLKVKIRYCKETVPITEDLNLFQAVLPLQREHAS
jgi:hypothetical protein